VRLAPLPPVITARDLGQLVDRTGLPAGTVEFALRLLLALKIAARHTIRVGPTQDKERHLVVHEDRLQALFALPPAERLRRVIDTWLAMDDAAELGPVVSRHGGLEVHFNRPYYVGWGTKGPEAAAARRLVARLIGRLPAGDTPYDLTSLLDLLWHLAPDRLGTATDHMGHATWWFTPEGQSSHRLDLEKRQDWLRVWRPLVESILAGPLTWLGLVEAERGEEAFRVRPAAAALSGRPVEGAPLEGTEPLVVEVAPGETALMVVVPPNTLNPDVHARLLELGEMAEASPLGLRYRLPAARIQFAFEDGMTGPELLDLLSDLAGGDLPAPARRLVERWWAGHGSVRLYDDLTLVELGDDLLLRELTATTSLRQGVIHTFSPRLVAVEPALADTLVRELLRLGHTPSVVEAP
jgi:hypothetical protein